MIDEMGEVHRVGRQTELRAEDGWRHVEGCSIFLAFLNIASDCGGSNQTSCDFDNAFASGYCISGTIMLLQSSSNQRRNWWRMLPVLSSSEVSQRHQRRRRCSDAQEVEQLVLHIDILKLLRRRKSISGDPSLHGTASMD